MPISIVCSCGKRLRLADEMQGKKVRCPGCKTPLTVEQADAPEPPGPALRTKSVKAAPRPAPKTPDGSKVEVAPKPKKSSAKVFWLLGCGCLGLLMAGGAAVVAFIVVAANSVKLTTATVASQNNVQGGGTEQTDLKIASLDVDAKGLLPCMMWTDNTGSAFYAVDGNQGNLHRFSGADYTTKQTTNLNVKASWLSLSAEGLVLTIADRSEVRLLDPNTFVVKKTIPIPQLKRAVSASSLSFCVAWTGTFGAELIVVDLKTGAQSKVVAPRLLGTLGYGEELMMSPDGQSLYTNALSGTIVHWHVRGNTIAYAEKGPRMHAGSPYVITISADSKYVAQPCGGGNSDAGKPQSTLILNTTLQRQCVLTIGTHPAPLGFDVVNNAIYTGNPDMGLVTFDLASGVKKKEYKKFGKGNPRQYLVHPAGKRFVALQQAALLYVEIKN